MSDTEMSIRIAMSLERIATQLTRLNDREERETIAREVVREKVVQYYNKLECPHIHRWGCVHCGNPRICSKCSGESCPCRIVTLERSKQPKDTLIASGVARFYFKDGHTEFEITYVRPKDH